VSRPSQLEHRGVAGVCIEDKLFPKTNSLLDGRAQPLADPEEFALKITAMKVCTMPQTSQCFFAV
jgi:phosphoenolpyruvate phosphomutase